MPHHVYTTRGIVLSLGNIREADRMVTIFTRDLGLVRAEVRGVRKLTSRLATSLREFSIVKTSLVKGQRIWRVTSTTLIRDTITELGRDRARLEVLYRVGSFVRKMVSEEDKNIDLYDELERTFEILSKERPAKADWELFAVSRILVHLGYISTLNAPKEVREVDFNRKALVAMINKGIRESGLE